MRTLSPFKNPFIEEEKEDGVWLTDRLTDDTLTFIEENKDAPFFVNLHYYAPHRPSVKRNEELLAHFKSKKGDPKTGQGLGKNKEIAEYATMVKSIDDNVARILTKLDELGLRENTVVIFTSDNGFNGLQSVNKNLRGAKGNAYDGGLRVPSLVSWKGSIIPKSVDTPIQGMDYFPTFLELAGVTDYEQQLDGDSIVPLFQEKNFAERPLFWHLASKYKDPPCSIVRERDWKLIQFLLNGKVELYNTKEDLKESQNLAKVNKEKTQELLEKLIAWRTSNHVPLPPSSKLEF